MLIENGEIVQLSLRTDSLSWKVHRDFPFAITIDPLIVKDDEIYNLSDLPDLVEEGYDMNGFHTMLAMSMFGDEGHESTVDNLTALFSYDGKKSTGQEKVHDINTLILKDLFDTIKVKPVNIFPNTNIANYNNQTSASNLVERVYDNIDEVFQIINEHDKEVTLLLTYYYIQIGFMLHTLVSTSNPIDSTLDMGDYDAYIKRTIYGATYIFPNGFK